MLKYFINLLLFKDYAEKSNIKYKIIKIQNSKNSNILLFPS
ncbi:protein of unknown function [Clostridium beijerinckii]|nr:protein of unknown function [Clostridium beijerinckii]